MADPRTAELVDALSNLPDDQRGKITDALASAVVSYQRTGRTDDLAQFAHDLITTVTLRQDPSYVHASAVAPTSSTGTGRLVKEIFAAVRS